MQEWRPENRNNRLGDRGVGIVQRPHGNSGLSRPLLGRRELRPLYPAVVINRQSQVRIDLRVVRRFVRLLGTVLPLRRRRFDVCFVNDREIQRLNAAYRGESRPTDVLSFPWMDASPAGRAPAAKPRPKGWDSEFAGFLGDVIISAETARRNARREKHSITNEVFWLILHGVLHLLGYDHETDGGEMTQLELWVRGQLGIAGQWGTRSRRRFAAAPEVFTRRQRSRRGSARLAAG